LACAGSSGSPKVKPCSRDSREKKNPAAVGWSKPQLGRCPVLTTPSGCAHQQPHSIHVFFDHDLESCQSAWFSNSYTDVVRNRAIATPRRIQSCAPVSIAAVFRIAPVSAMCQKEGLNQIHEL